MGAASAITASHQDGFALAMLLPSVGLALASIYVLARSFENTAHSKFWRSLDVVGVSHPGLISWTKAILDSVLNTAQSAAEGYQQFCKAKNIPFALPTVWTGRAVVVLPPQLLPVLNRPDSELAAHRAQHETIQLPYMIADRNVYDNPIQFDVVRRTMMPAQIGSLAAATGEELDAAFSANWPGENDPHDWVTLNCWNACGKVISRAAMRVLVGEPLCRDERLLDLSTQYADAVIQGTAIINCLPPFLRPLFGPLCGLRAKVYQSRCLKILVPLIQQRIRVGKEDKSVANELPNDFLQWMIERCAKAGPEQMDASRIAMRLLALDTMSVMGMVWVLSHCIQDLYRSPSKEMFLPGLEEECGRLIDARQSSEITKALGSKDTLDQLHRLDSALRESMRLSNISIVSLARDVVVDELDLGHYGSSYDGLRIPKGVRVVFPTQSMHRDPDFSFHDEPLRFDAFRFSRSFENRREHEDNETTMPDRAAVSATAPSQSLLVWGYGKHACTGRWFAAQTLKQALAYVVLKYDIEVLSEPRERKSLVNVMLPHLDVEIRVRRKTATKSTV